MKSGRGLALPLVLMYVLVAFFAATAMLVRVRHEASASVYEISGFQREALARSALVTLLAKLEEGGDEQVVSLAGTDGRLRAKAWVESGQGDLLHLYARVQGNGGPPFLAQKVVRKKPALTPIDYAHLADGDLFTSDGLKMRISGSAEWLDLPSPSSSLMWVEADRRGNLFGMNFPALNGHGTSLPLALLSRLIEQNDSYLRQGLIEFDFFKAASLAVEENWRVDLENLPSAGVAVDVGSSTPVSHGALPLPPEPDQPPSTERTARFLADELARGASLWRYTNTSGSWESISLDLPPGESGRFPGRVASNGKYLYLPVLGPGPDLLRQFDLEKLSWSSHSTPPALIRPADGKLAYGQGATASLIAVEVDDDGGIVAQHGDEGNYGLSYYHPRKKVWELLPTPPGSYIDIDGHEVLLLEEASSCDTLEVGEQGEVYMIWRSKQEPAVTEYLTAKGPVVPTTNPIAAPVPTPDDGNISWGADSVPSPDGPTPWEPDSVPSPGGLMVGDSGTSVWASSPFGAESASQIGLAEYAYEAAQDMILCYRDGRWTTLRLADNSMASLGSVDSGPGQTLLAHDVRPGSSPDRLFGLSAQGKLEAAVHVPGLDSLPAEYFSVTCGARPIPNRFKLQETASY